MTGLRSRAAHASVAVVAVALLIAVGTMAVLVLVADPATSTVEQRTHQIASGLRCPVCQDLSAADSPAPLARQMRQQIRDQLTRGVPAADIEQGFVDAYGVSVLMSPPNRGWGRAVHLLPFVVLASAATAGVLLLRGAVRRRPEPSSLDDGPVLVAADRHRVERALAELRREEP
jgi:cytochrome c-type biogenesis protein CcmH